MTRVLPYHGRQPLEIAVLALFAVLFGWISAGFWTAIAGFVLLVSGRDRFAISRRTCCDSARGDPRRCAHRDRHADLQRGRGTGVRRDCAPPTNRCATPARSTASISSCCPTAAIRTSASPRSTPGPGSMPRRRRVRAHLLPLAPAPDQAQERQRRRLLPALGPQVPLHGRARRRQRHERRLPDDAGAHRRGQPRRRHHPDRAARRRPRHASTRASSSSPPASTDRCSPQACISGSSASRTTGATTRSSASRLSSGTARSAACRGSGALSGEILSHDFVEAALMRRAGWGVWIAYDLPGQLRGDAAESDRRADARPALVPGQPDEFPPLLDERPASRAPRGLHDRRAGLPVGAAVVRCS